MIELNLQFFGGRGATSGISGGKGGYATKNEAINRANSLSISDGTPYIMTKGGRYQVAQGQKELDYAKSKGWKISK